MAELKIHITIQSRYRVLDASGKLPFGIVFGLCRHSSADTDPRSLTLSTTDSVFDVPHALTRGLLELCEVTGEDVDEVQFDLSDLNTAADTNEGQSITLASPVGRTDNWRNAFTNLLYEIKPESALASRLQTEKSYTIRMTGQDLGVRSWTYADLERPEPAKLLNQKSSAGTATFKVVPSLPWPPKLETRFRLQSTTSDGETIVAISALNTSDRTVTAQTRGHQRFLTPTSPFFRPGQDDITDHRPRLIDTASERVAPSALQVIDLTSGAVVYQMPAPTSAPLTQGHDPRARRQDVVELRPNEPMVREVDVSNLLKRVPDGQYGLRMVPRGMWWCEGSLEDVVDSDDRIVKEKWNTTIPPLMLESEDIVKIEVREGRGVATLSS